MLRFRSQKYHNTRTFSCKKIVKKLLGNIFKTILKVIRWSKLRTFTVPFLGIFDSNFRYCVFAVGDGEASLLPLFLHAEIAPGPEGLHIGEVQAGTANEEPVRIQFNCLVPIYVFPGMKLFFPVLPVLTLIYL